MARVMLLPWQDCEVHLPSEWPSAKRLAMNIQLRRNASTKLIGDVEQGLKLLDRAKEYELWRDLDETWEVYLADVGLTEEALDIYREGLAILKARGHRVVTAEQIEELGPLFAHGGDRTGKQADKTESISLTNHGTDPVYLARRIMRDAPEVFEHLEDYPSMQAAAREAGIVKDKRIPAWQKVVNAYNKLEDEQRELARAAICKA